MQLLACAWRGPETLRLMFAEAVHFLPALESVAALFRDPATVASAWAHLLCLDLLVARELLQDGRRRGVATAHSVLLCFMCGPLGLLAHLATRALAAATRRAGPAHSGGDGAVGAALGV